MHVAEFDLAPGAEVPVWPSLLDMMEIGDIDPSHSDFAEQYHPRIKLFIAFALV